MAMRTPCPVCSTGVYTDLRAPMAKDGTENPEHHSCVDNGTWRGRNRFGGSIAALRQQLVETPPEKLVGWPKVQVLKEKAERGEAFT